METYVHLMRGAQKQTAQVVFTRPRPHSEVEPPVWRIGLASVRIEVLSFSQFSPGNLGMS
jgi:hypothetical protein